MSKFTRLVLTCFTLALCCALGSAPGLAAAPKVIKLGTTVNEQDSFQVAALKFAELIKARSKGEYVVEIYPNGALGDERAMLEGMRMGTMDMGIITSGPFVNFVPEFGVLDMPFLFSNPSQAHKVLDGEVGREILAKLEEVNIKGLAYAERGFRNLTNNVRPVHAAGDAKGLKVRVMENEVYTSSFRALGVNAVPMAWPEALTALQQGTVDGQENPVNVIHAFTLLESQKYVTMPRHAYAAAIFTMSKQLFDKLSQAMQKTVLEAAQEAAAHERAWVADNEARQLAELKQQGMIVDEKPALESFKAAVRPVYEKYPAYAPYLQRIRAALGQ